MNIYQDIAQRTKGNIYIGVMGPVRTGKSTFIKRVAEKLVLPNIEDEFQRQRTIDELPQSAAGKTIMTAEPKFIPEEAVRISVEQTDFNIKMIDCVGYIVPSAIGYMENDSPRMVMTPWFDKPVPFNMAAEIGTKRVIEEHSTVGVMVTADGSFGELSREEYLDAEQRIVDELKEINKPFVVLLNSTTPNSEQAVNLAGRLQEEWKVPVIPVNCTELEEKDIKDILSRLIFEFPVRSIDIDMPEWVDAISQNAEIKKKIYGRIMENAKEISKIRQIKKYCRELPDGETIVGAKLKSGNLGNGRMSVEIEIPHKFFYDELTAKSGLEIKGDKDIMENLSALAVQNRKMSRYYSAIEQAQKEGYGIVSPQREEYDWEVPEVIKQNGKYGIRLKAKAPSVHIIRADIETEIAPLVGTQVQAQELISYLTENTKEDRSKIFDCDIFGKPLHFLVNEGLEEKLSKMPTQAREKMQETLQKIMNEGTDGLICIII